jgi:SpoVK/Ycf46/Vps4 family AAA+-type ATPase
MIAREIAKIYMSYGLLKKGHLVETDRAGLVGEYVGQTAIKTKEKIAEAMGGVLFIDEAYSLLDGSGGYGKEAIDTLLKEMEDSRDEFVVIVAGYGKEMGEFINSNPGLQSRFSTVINFPDYSAEELMQIFELAAKKDGSIVADDARDWLAQWLNSSAPLGAKGFGNGRFVRNLFEKTVVAQSHRLAEINAVEKEVLQLIGISDIKVGASAIE